MCVTLEQTSWAIDTIGYIHSSVSPYLYTVSENEHHNGISSLSTFAQVPNIL